jgi:2-pyrone-4,6-dicarboxylate lactonase
MEFLDLDRRTLVGVAAMAGAGSVLAACVGTITQDEEAKSMMPAGAWDCHTHIYGPFDRFPIQKGAAYTPEPAPFTALRALHERLGIAHGVLVQAAPYGIDHSAILDAIAASGGQYRGIGLIDDTVSDAQLQGLHDGGIRGIRFNLMGHLPGSRDPATLRRLAERIHALGWHALVHGELSVLLPVLEQWHTLATPLVIDHMARPDLTRPIDAVQLDALRAQLRHPARWIKLSGVDRAMGGAAAPWPQAVAHVRGLIDAAPDRAIWGTDWPHPNIKGPTPDDAALARFVLDVCDTPERTRAVLVDNPQRLYA